MIFARLFRCIANALFSFVLLCNPLATRSQWWTLGESKLKWGKLPIHVDVHKAFSRESVDLIESAIKNINDSVGFRLFSPSVTMTNHMTHQVGRVTVIAWDKENHGLCNIKVTKDDQIQSALIRSYIKPHPHIVVHELLHSVGLLHTTGILCGLSIMCPKIQSKPRILLGDVLQIQEMYKKLPASAEK